MSYVVCFMFSKCRRYVTLILKDKPQWQHGRYNGIGGKIEEGETPEEAIIREVKEETGITINEKPKLFCKLLPVDGRGTEVYFFRYFLASGQLPKTCEKEIVKAFRVTDLPHNIIINLHWMVPMALIDDENTYLIEEKK